MRTKGQPGCRPSVPGEFPSDCFFKEELKRNRTGEGGEEGEEGEGGGGGEVWKEFILD